MKNANAAMPTTPAARPSSPSMKLTALIVTTTSRMVRTIPLRGEFARRAHPPAVVDEPGHDDQPAREQQAAGRAEVARDADAAREDSSHVGELARHEERRGEAAVHGKPAEPRRGHRVDVAVAH